MLNFCLLTPKRHILSRNRVVWRIARENRFRGLGCRLLEEPEKKKPSKHFDAQFRAYGEKKPLEGSWLNFARSVDIHDVITCATFCDDRLRGLGVARGQISRFPIDLRRRPYSTRTAVRVCDAKWEVTAATATATAIVNNSVRQPRRNRLMEVFSTSINWFVHRVS